MCDALGRARPLSPQGRARALARLAEIRAMTPDAAQTPSEQLVREVRDDRP